MDNKTLNKTEALAILLADRDRKRFWWHTVNNGGLTLTCYLLYTHKDVFSEMFKIIPTVLVVLSGIYIAYSMIIHGFSYIKVHWSIYKEHNLVLGKLKVHVEIYHKNASWVTVFAHGRAQIFNSLIYEDGLNADYEEKDPLLPK